MSDIAAEASVPNAPVVPAAEAAPDAVVGRTKVFYKPDQAPEPGAPRPKVDRIKGLSAKMAEIKAKKEAPADASAKTDEAPKDAQAAQPADKPAESKPGPAQFAALARAEKRIREQAKAIEERDAKSRAELEAEQAKLTEAREIQRLLAGGDKYALLDHFKIDVNEWARRQIGAPPKTEAPAEPKVDEVAKLRAEIAAEKEATALRDAEQQALADVGALVHNSGEKYELIGLRRAQAAVVELLKEHYKQTGRMLEYAEACDMVEAELEQDAASYVGAQKVKKKFAAPPTSAAASPEATRSDNQRPPKTTTRTQPNKTAAPDRVPSSRLSREERIKKAAELLRAGRQR